MPICIICSNELASFSNTIFIHSFFLLISTNIGFHQYYSIYTSIYHPIKKKPMYIVKKLKDDKTIIYIILLSIITNKLIFLCQSLLTYLGTFLLFYLFKLILCILTTPPYQLFTKYYGHNTLLFLIKSLFIIFQ